MIGRVSDSLEVAKEQKTRDERELEQRGRQIAKLELTYKSVSREFVKVRVQFCPGEIDASLAS